MYEITEGSLYEGQMNPLPNHWGRICTRKVPHVIILWQRRYQPKDSHTIEEILPQKLSGSGDFYNSRKKESICLSLFFQASNEQIQVFEHVEAVH